jgi:prophage regulatory protein
MNRKSSPPKKVSAREERRRELQRFLSRAEVRDLTGLSTTTLWREIRAGRFPEAVALSPNRKGFRFTDVADWMQARTSKGGRPC